MTRRHKTARTLVAEERARDVALLRAHNHDLLAGQQLLRNDRRHAAEQVTTSVNDDELRGANGIEGGCASKDVNETKHEKSSEGQARQIARARAYLLKHHG